MRVTSEQLQAITGTRILVLGDLIVDHYIRGTTERTSPEAPVPVVLFRDEQVIPGGAANVARNIRAAGADVHCVGIAGTDDEGNRLIQAMEAAGLPSDGVVRIAGHPTTVKTRIVSQGQQMLRLDRESDAIVSLPEQERVFAAFRERLPSCSAVIVSDYAKGVLSPFVLSSAIREAEAAGIPLFVDPKGRDYSRYQGAYALTPNAREASEASGIALTSSTALADAARAISAITGCQLLLITRGAEGFALFQKGSAEPYLMPTFAREVFDVTGAGDTFVAFLAMSIAAGHEAATAAEIANAAAGVVVGKTGAATVTLAELRSALLPERLGRKLRMPADLEELGRDLRSMGRRIVFTNGCFDFLHAGHVAMLQEARALGDVLVLATNTDDVIRRLKGKPRPIIAQAQREKLLASIEAVDYIVPFSDDTPHALIRALRPDILVKGSNYSGNQIEGREIVEEYGGRIELLDILQDISTTDLLAHRKQL